MNRFVIYLVSLIFLGVLSGCSTSKTVSTTLSDSVSVFKHSVDSVVDKTEIKSSETHSSQVTKENTIFNTQIDTVYIEKEHTIVIKESGDTLSNNTNTKERVISHSASSQTVNTVSKDSVDKNTSTTREVNTLKERIDSLIKASDSKYNSEKIIKKTSISQFFEDIGNSLMMFAIAMLVIVLAYSYYKDKRNDK